MSEATDKIEIELFRKFGLHASADALAARDAYREGKTCRTCVHLDSDPRYEPCATCTRFGKWQGARAEQSKAPNGVAPTVPAQPVAWLHYDPHAIEGEFPWVLMVNQDHPLIHAKTERIVLIAAGVPGEENGNG